MQYEIEFGFIEEKIRKLRPKRVLIQLPAGLRIHFLSVAHKIKELGVEPVFWAGSCYGACDLPEYSKADLLIHFGHGEFKKK